MRQMAAILMVFAAGYAMKGGAPPGAEGAGTRADARLARNDIGRDVAELKAELRSEFRSELAKIRRSSEFLVATGTVKNGKTVPLPNEGSWRDGTPILPGQWVIAVSIAYQWHTWRGTPKADHCAVDQDSRVVTVYSEKWTYPGEGKDVDGVASYTIICSRGLGRPTEAEVF